MKSIQASWRQIAGTPEIQRSSQTVFLAVHDLLLFGGEIKPRQPVDSKLYRIPLDGPQSPITVVNSSSSAPSARVGSASTTLHGKTYLFSGRGGEDMAPIEEHGAVYVLDNQEMTWLCITPADSAKPHPQARSYHAMTTDEGRTIYLHAGCPEKGRLSDLWAFDTQDRKWSQLADAPGPSRGGTSIAFCRDKLYRMNGFDGKNEQGFALDSYDVKSNTWTTETWEANEGPPPRSVSTLSALQIGGRDMLVTMFGECDPSTLGHQGAGKMLDDVWAYDLTEGSWMRVEIVGHKPQSRGWFAADTLRKKNSIVIQGGLAEDNTRIGDAWILAF